MKIQDALEYTAKKLGSATFDIIANDHRSSDIEIFRGKVKSREASHSFGIGLRLFYTKNNKTQIGYAYTNRLSPDSLKGMIATAQTNAQLSEVISWDPQQLQSNPPPKVYVHNTHPKLSADQLIEMGLKLESEVNDNRIENIPFLSTHWNSGVRFWLNSAGVVLTESSTSSAASLGVLATHPAGKKMGVFSDGGFDLQYFDPKKMAQKAVDRAVRLLGASSISGGKRIVIFSRRVATRLLGMYQSIFFGERVQKGNSRLKGKLNQLIAAPLMNLTDDPHKPNAPTSTGFDDEGISTQKLSLIENGFLKNFMHHRESAAIENRLSTGHALRSPASKAQTSSHHMVIEKGEKSLKELLEEIPGEVLLIEQLEGSSGCSSVSGDLSIGAQGQLYRDGKHIQPVDRIILAGNFFDILKQTKAFSNQYESGFRSISVPDWVVDKVDIAGSNHH